MSRQATSSPPPAERPRYLEESAPLIFPEEEEVPESQIHLELRTLLYQLLADTLGLEATVGSGQFMYFDAADPKKVLAPDVYVKLTPPTSKVRSWKVWERGAPDVAIEIVSESDEGDVAWQRNLGRYRQLGLKELVRFDPESAKQPLRIWDRVDGNLREREIGKGGVHSQVLKLYWQIAPTADNPVTLRLARTQKADSLIPTIYEAHRDAEVRQAKAEQEQAKAEQEQAKAEARIRELEEELGRR